MALLIPWAQGYQGSQDKEKDSADLNRNAIPRSIFRICAHHLFSLLLECEKVKACLAGLNSRTSVRILDFRSSRLGTVVSEPD